MNSGNRPDDLLLEVLKDDLPCGTERNMKKRFLRFREREIRAGRESRRIWTRWAIHEEVLSFASLLLIIAGVLLHVSGDRGAVAQTLCLLNASVSIADELLGAASMECNLKVASGTGSYSHYTIRWVPPDITRVDTDERDDLHDSLWISGSDRASVDDPLIAPIRQFLSPETLADAIYREWKPKRLRLRSGEETETAVYTNGQGRLLIEMTADRSTRLPVRIRKLAAGEVVLEAHFIWNEPIATEAATPNR